MSEKQKVQVNLEKPIEVVIKHPLLIDNDNNTRLHFAAANGDKKEVLNYLENESKIVDVENFLGWTPLMMACRRGHTEIANCLLEKGANATKKNKFGMNILLITIASGNLALVQLILEHLLTGGISRRRMEDLLSPVSVAVLFKHPEIWKYLLTREFDLNVTTQITAITPLMFATAMEHSKAFMELLQAGADATMKNWVGHTAFDIATLRKNLRNRANNIRTPYDFAKNVIIRSPNILPSSVSSTQNVPCIIVSQQPSFFQIASPVFGPNIHVRRSSNISPFFYPPPPNVTPISPAPQVFFPSDFSPRHVFSNNSPTFLESTNGLNASEFFLSPQLVNYD